MGEFLQVLRQWLEFAWPLAKIEPWSNGVRCTYFPVNWVIKPCRRHKCIHIRRVSPYVKTVLLGPGTWRKVPWWEEVYERAIVEDTLDLKTQSITTTDNQSVSFSANIVFEVFDVEAATVNVQEFEVSLTRAAESHLTRRCRDKSWDELRLGVKELEDSLKNTLTTRAKKWGVKIVDVGLTTLVRAAQLRQFQISE